MINVDIKRITEEIGMLEFLIAVIEKNKKNIIDHYLINERAIYEVADEDEAEFIKLLKSELSGFLTTLKKVDFVFDRSPIVFERAIDIPDVTVQKVSEMLGTIVSLIEKIGSESVMDVEEDIHEYKHYRNDSEGFEKANELLDFLNDLVNVSIELVAEIEVILDVETLEAMIQ